MTFLQDIADALEPHMPEGWIFRPYTDEPDVLDRTTLVMLDPSEVRPGLTFGSLVVDVHAYILIPTYDSAERNSSNLMEVLLPFLSTLFRIKSVEQGTANPRTFTNGNPCWDVLLTFHVTIPEE